MSEQSDRLLYILRHAKSSWEDASLPDFERPLAPRGRKQTRLLARYLKERDIRPELVICSSARRARETYEGVAPAGELMIDSGLYGATAAEVVERVKQVPDDVSLVMVIGHNPAMQAVVVGLAAEEAADAALVAIAREKFPTAALATLRFAIPWRELGPGRGELSDFLRPADL